MSATVVVTEMSKWFGLKVAVSQLSVGFLPGVTGLLGPNGAGKTTLLRVIAGLQRPSQGRVSVLGADPRSDPSVYRHMSLVPEDEAIYERQTGHQFLLLAARLARIDDPPGAAKRALEAVGLTEEADRRLGAYSKGMRQRAKVAAALVADPDVLLLDEPLNGADPVQRSELIRLFQRLGNSGRTVIVSSHVLAEVERMASRVVAMVDGRLAAVGSVAEIRAAMTDRPRHISIRSSHPRVLAADLIGTDGVIGVHVAGDSLVVEASDAGQLARTLPRIAVSRHISISHVEPSDESLESVFRYLVEQR
ncbi:MAG: ABC transporter ATP-binding protein [Acidimicrobiia bacterium]|nr:ABC transporter ATP-binding protein [Acidimicrobiia bacterium]